VAFLSGMSLAAQQGITIKTAKVLECATQLTAAVLDKTGTLTMGSPTVSSFSLENENISQNRLLQMVASLEAQSSHMLGKAILNFIKTRNPNLGLLEVDGLQEENGRGISGFILEEDVSIAVGTLDFLQSYGVPSSMFSSEMRKQEQQQTSSFVAINGQPCATFSFTDQLREEAQLLISSLRQFGIQHVALLSGDRSCRVAAVAEELGLDSWESCLPHQKADHVATLQAGGHCVLAIGDGHNDAAVLAQADIGIALTAKGLVSQSADVVMLEPDLAKCWKLLGLSHKVMNTSKLGLKMGMGMSMVQMCLSALGFLSPLKNAALQECVDLAAILNSLSVLWARFE